MRRTAALRAHFRDWRETRPFWAGFWTLLGGFLMAYVPATAFKFALMPGSMLWTGVLVGVLVMVLGLMMWVQPHLRVLVASLSLVLSLFSFLSSDFGGLILGMILGLTGGCMAIAWTPGEEVQPAPAPEAAAPVRHLELRGRAVPVRRGVRRIAGIFLMSMVLTVAGVAAAPAPTSSIASGEVITIRANTLVADIRGVGLRTLALHGRSVTTLELTLANVQLGSLSQLVCADGNAAVLTAGDRGEPVTAETLVMDVPPLDVPIVLPTLPLLRVAATGFEQTAYYLGAGTIRLPDMHLDVHPGCDGIPTTPGSVLDILRGQPSSTVGGQAQPSGSAGTPAAGPPASPGAPPSGGDQTCIPPDATATPSPSATPTPLLDGLLGGLLGGLLSPTPAATPTPTPTPTPSPCSATVSAPQPS